MAKTTLCQVARHHSAITTTQDITYITKKYPGTAPSHICYMRLSKTIPVWLCATINVCSCEEMHKVPPLGPKVIACTVRMERRKLGMRLNQTYSLVFCLTKVSPPNTQAHYAASRHLHMYMYLPLQRLGLTLEEIHVSSR